MFMFTKNLGQLVDVYVHKKLDINQAYFRNYDGKSNSNQRSDIKAATVQGSKFT